MAHQDDIDNFRLMTGEVIPDGGDESDTLFTDEAIDKILADSANSEEAILKGWRIKQAHFANLVNVIDGAAARTFGELFDHATQMVKQWTVLAVGPTAGRTRVGKIIRS